MKKSEAIQAMIYLGVVVQKVRSNLQEWMAGIGEPQGVDEQLLVITNPELFGPMNIIQGIMKINDLAAMKGILRPGDVHNILYLANQEPLLYIEWGFLYPQTPWPVVTLQQLKGWDDELTTEPVPPAAPLH